MQQSSDIKGAGFYMKQKAQEKREQTNKERLENEIIEKPRSVGFFMKLNKKLAENEQKYARIAQKLCKMTDDKNVKKLGKDIDIFKKFDEFRALFTDEREEWLVKYYKKEDEKSQQSYYDSCGVRKQYQGMAFLEAMQDKRAELFASDLITLKECENKCNILFESDNENTIKSASAILRVACGIRNNLKKEVDAKYSTRSFYTISWVSAQKLTYLYARTLYNTDSVFSYCYDNVMVIEDVNPLYMSINERKTLDVILKKRFFADKKTIVIPSVNQSSKDTIVDSKVDLKTHFTILKLFKTL